MMTHKIIPLLLVGLLAASAAARTQVLVLRDGRTIEGEITQTAEGYVVRTRIATLVFPPDQVVGVQEVMTPEDEYRQRLAQIDRSNPAQRYALAQWAVEQNLLEAARDELQEVLAMQPDHEQANLLLSLVQRRLESTGPVEPNGDPTVPTADRLWISARDMNRIRLAELATRRGPEGVRVIQDRVPIRMQGDVIDRYVRYMAGRDEFREQNFERRFRGMDARTQAAYMLRSLPDDSPMRDDILVMADPASIVTFRRQIWPVIERLVTTVYERQGLTRPQIGNLMGVSRPDQRAYTTFLLVNGLRVDGRAMIDRNTPEDSLLLQWGLPPEDAKFPAPAGFPRLYTARNDVRYQRVLAWIRSLQTPHPQYDLEYEPPYDIRLHTGGRPPLPPLPGMDTPPDGAPATPAPPVFPG